MSTHFFAKLGYWHQSQDEPFFAIHRRASFFVP